MPEGPKFRESELKTVEEYKQLLSANSLLSVKCFEVLSVGVPQFQVYAVISPNEGEIANICH